MFSLTIRDDFRVEREMQSENREHVQEQKLGCCLEGMREEFLLMHQRSSLQEMAMKKAEITGHRRP
jgi:hypothetical protein